MGIIAQHQTDDVIDAAFPVTVEHTAQGRTKLGVDFRVQVIDALRQFTEMFLRILHCSFPSLQKEYEHVQDKDRD